MNNILSLIILLGAIQGGILSVVLYRSRFNQTANKVLAAAIFAVSIALLLAYFQLTLDYKEYQFQIKSILPLSLIFIPLIYVYTRLNTKEDSKLSISDIKYFLPFIVVFIYNMPFYFGSADNKIAYYTRESISNSALLTDQIEIIIVSFIILAYSGWISTSSPELQTTGGTMVWKLPTTKHFQPT